MEVLETINLAHLKMIAYIAICTDVGHIGRLHFEYIEHFAYCKNDPRSWTQQRALAVRVTFLASENWNRHPQSYYIIELSTTQDFSSGY